MFYFILLTLICASFSEDCTSSQDFLKIVRTTKTYANEESHQVLDGSAIRVDATGFANNEVRTTEYCISKSSNSMYTLKLKDSNNDSWYAGSMIELFNIYGTCLIKRFMLETSEETFQFSLLMPVARGATWKRSATFTSGWASTSFSDSTWESMTAPGPSSSQTGTNYFRITFGAGSTPYAAYEILLNYRHGVLVHMNGLEILRDNMPSGDVGASTQATGTYSAFAYRAIIRNAHPLTSSGNVLAVEVHPDSSSGISMYFDANLALLSSTSPTGDNCFAVNYPADVVASTGTTYGPRLVDGFKTQYFYSASSGLPATGTFTYTAGTIFAQFNGWEYFIGSLNTYAPKEMILQGAMSSSSSTFSPIATIFGTTSVANKYYTMIIPFAQTMFNIFRLTVVSSHTTSIYIYEGFPLVCGVAIPTSITFAKSSYTIKSHIDDLRVYPAELGVTGCTISPSPTQYGLSWDSPTCTLSGSSNSTFSQSFTWSYGSITGSVSITSESCNDSVLVLLRNYGSSTPVDEIYTILTMSGTVIYDEAASTVQTASAALTRRACVPATRYRLNLAVNNNVRLYWYVNSYLTVQMDHKYGELEIILRTRFDLNNNMPTTYYFSLLTPVSAMSQWFYKHDYASADWFSASTSGWSQGTVGNFGSSTNAYQVYRKTFSVSASELESSGAFALRVRYQYGMIVYMNGYEVYRNNIGSGSLESASVTGTYSTLMYRHVTLPTTTMKTDSEDPKQYLKSGDNTIGIAFKGLSTSGWASTFDVTLRLVGDTSSDRVFSYTGTYTGVSGSADYAWGKYYAYSMYTTACGANHIQIEFADERREWISSAAVVNYYSTFYQLVGTLKLSAKNPSDSEFTLLSTQSGWKWWAKAQWKRFYFQNNKSYSIYRFSDIGTGVEGDCSWRINDIVLFSDKTDITLGTLSYPSMNSGFKDIELAEIFPDNNAMRSSFSVSPALPSGVFIDTATGVLMGTPLVLASSTQYTVSFMSVSGQTQTATLNFEVIYCENNRALVSVVIRVDSYPTEVQYNLYNGRGTSGTLVSSATSMPTASTYYWVDTCLNFGLYTFEGIDTYGDGWTWPANWRITIDWDLLSVAYAHIETATKPVKSIYTFSSNLPFQVELSQWKVYKELEAPPTNWLDRDFADTWASMKAVDIGVSSAATIYLRQKFDIPNLSDYHVLNMHARYSCGLVGYFNSRMVALFNLPKKYSHNTYCTDSSHDFSIYSRFHVILETDGAQLTGNVMAFEVHKNAQTSSAEPFVFDASAIYGVENECNFVVTNYNNVTASWDVNADYSAVVDMIPFTYITFQNAADNQLFLSHENQAPVRFNAYYLSVGQTFTNFGWTVDGRFDMFADWIDTAVETGVGTTSRRMTKYYDEVGMAGFTHLRYYMTVPGSGALQISEFALLYCHTTGQVCQGDDVYPTVANGAKSPALCPQFYTGYRYKECTNGVLGPENSSACKMLVPENLSYSMYAYSFVRDTASTTGKPTYDNIISEYVIADEKKLPFGLELNPETGEISGTPVVISQSMMYSILGINDNGRVRCDIYIDVRVGTCKPDGVFKGVEVDEVSKYECSNEGNSVGTRTRKCVIGERDGVWEKPQGSCWSIILIVILVFIGILVIVVVIFVVTRGSRKTVKGGKKASKSSKTKASSKKGSGSAPVKI